MTNVMFYNHENILRLFIIINHIYVNNILSLIDQHSAMTKKHNNFVFYIIIILCGCAILNIIYLAYQI